MPAFHTGQPVSLDNSVWKLCAIQNSRYTFSAMAPAQQTQRNRST